MSKKRLSPLLMVVGVVLVNYAVIAIAVRAGGDVPTATWLAQAGACIAAGVAAVCWGLTLRPVLDSQVVSFDSQFIDAEARKDLSALHRLAERMQANHEVMATLRLVMQGGATITKREPVAEGSVDPPAGKEQGVFFL
jgi:hypothetical protein